MADFDWKKANFHGKKGFECLKSALEEGKEIVKKDRFKISSQFNRIISDLSKKFKQLKLDDFTTGSRTNWVSMMTEIKNAPGKYNKSNKKSSEKVISEQIENLEKYKKQLETAIGASAGVSSDDSSRAAGISVVIEKFSKLDYVKYKAKALKSPKKAAEDLLAELNKKIKTAKTRLKEIQAFNKEKENYLAALAKVADTPPPPPLPPQ